MSGRGRKSDKKRRDVPVAEDGQAYARVVAMLGNGRVTARLADGVEVPCRIRGTMRRREWVNVGDLVLVCARELAGDKADIVFRYLPPEVQSLRRMGEAVDFAVAEDEDDDVVFRDDDAPPGDDQLDWDAL